ncbi:MAG: hypothetical protein ABEJ28_04185 [Salinigranum sp.]
MHQALVIAKVATMSLGFLIAYQAYQGYRRQGSSPMLYVALGFFFISIGAVIEGILFEIFDLRIFVAGAIQTGIVAVGMLFVLYSLYGDARHTSNARGDTE